MYCKNCMKEITDGAVFCGHCGARLIYPEEPLNVSGITGSGAFGGEKCEEDAPAGPRRVSDNITVDQNGVYNCASSREQAERAVGLIGDNCRLVETDTSDHTIHTVHSDVYIEAVNSLLGGETGK